MQKRYINRKIAWSKWDPTQRRFRIERNAEGFLGAPTTEHDSNNTSVIVTNTFGVLQEEEQLKNEPQIHGRANLDTANEEASNTNIEEIDNIPSHTYEYHSASKDTTEATNNTTATPKSGAQSMKNARTTTYIEVTCENSEKHNTFAEDTQIRVEENTGSTREWMINAFHQDMSKNNDSLAMNVEPEVEVLNKISDAVKNDELQTPTIQYREARSKFIVSFHKEKKGLQA